MQEAAQFDKAAWDAHFDLMGYLFGGAFVLVFGSLITVIVLKLRNIPTFQAYRQLHPMAKDGKGTPNCFNCNSSNIWLAAGFPFSVHVCRVCGTKLWRS